MKRWWVWLWVWLLLGVVPAQAQDPLPQYKLHAEYQYGQLIRFYLTAETITPVSEITLLFSTPTMPNTYTISQTINPTQTIEVQQTIDLSQLRLNPFAPITFWWALTDESGQTILTPEQSINYADDRFNWQEMEQDGVVVHWTELDVTVGQAALDVVMQTKPKLQAIVPASFPVPLHLYIYPTGSDIQAALRLTGMDWVAGHASPALGVVLVTATNEVTAPIEFQRTIPHELSHLLLYQAVATNYDQLPVWFNEGLATLFEAKMNSVYETILAEAVNAGTTLPFSELCLQFPTDEQTALLAYAQSSSLLALIQSRYGNHVLTEMVLAFADGAGCESAVQRVLGITLNELDQLWQKSRQTHPPLTRFWQLNRLWLILVASGFLGVGLLYLSPRLRPSSHT